MLLGAGFLALALVPAFPQHSVLEDDPRPREPKHKFQVFSRAEWEKSSFARPEDLKWFRDARFGLFITWGPASLTGGEISFTRQTHKAPDRRSGPMPDEEYDRLYQRFSPDQYDAAAWVKMAQAAGMKYIVFIAKHHDGFCMWDSRFTEYKVTNSPIRRDLLKELADACHKAGMPLGIYYSQRDWYHPDYFTANHARYIQFMHDQVRELLTNYGKVSILWFDAAWWGGMFKAEYWDSEKMYRIARQLQPHIIINNRSSIPGDFDTPEGYVGAFQSHRPWETCMPIAGQWSWKPDARVLSLQESLRLLVGTATGDGNLLLDLGPRADGTFETAQKERIVEMGAWLKKYGRSIYKTRGGPFYPGAWGGSTHRGKVVYVHILEPGGKLELPPLNRKIVSSRLLTGGTATVTQTETATLISIPPQHIDPIDTILELTLDKAVDDMVQGQEHGPVK